ncbi:MAG: sigma 54-interacting transcriptional regulator [Desulfobacterales bacterium]|nr:sigma 54-interacting transcriptional regulator [Desulfobacterales bacterium]
MNNPGDAVDIKRYIYSFDRAPVGIVWHDDKGKILRVNAYAAEKLGYTPEELVGNYLYKFVVMDTRESDSYYDTESSTSVRHNLFTKDGNLIPVKVLICGAGPGDADFGCAFFQDMSEKAGLVELLKTLEKETGIRVDNLKSWKTGLIDIPENVFSDFIGKSRQVTGVFKMICRVAPTPTTVLITGETGTGKELVARKIHELSDRSGERLVRVNCATLPAHLIEGELFGHERGAFTGAHSRKPGRFELAHGGTIFLDEIGEMPPELQTKLLRVLQEGEFERIGGTKTLKSDVRVVAATNQDLESLVRNGRFRSDLYFRLNAFPIHLPTLRERKEDIPLLADFFVQNYCTLLNREPKKIPGSFYEKLSGYHWPGNVRELQNIVERACILSTTDRLYPEDCHLPAADPGDAGASLPSFEENERRYIIRVLKKTGGKVFGPDGAAALMQLNPRTLTSKIKKLGIDKSGILLT